MEKIEVDECCDLGVKGSCVTCEFCRYCNGKWNHTNNQTTMLNRGF